MQKNRLGTILVSIVAVIILSVFVLLYINQNKADYLPENTPQNIVHNYIFSLNEKDYERAYNYLSTNLANYTFSEFQQALSDRENLIKNSSVTLGRIFDDGDEIVVQANIRRNYEQNLLTNPDQYNQFFHVVRDGENWKITTIPEPYWPEEWTSE